MKDSNSSISSGLDAIFNADRNSREHQSDHSLEFIVREVAISEIKPSSYQPRTKFHEYDLAGLAESILHNGILQPILVRKINNCYEIIAGERRWRAAKIAQLDKVPIIIKNVSAESVLAFALIENIQRKDLNIVEEARAYNRLLNELKLSHDEIATRVGKSRPQITNILRLLNLSKYILTCLEDDLISAGHARCLLSIEENKRENFLQIIIEKQLSVRETERLVKNVIQTEQSPLILNQTHFDQTKISYWESKLSDIISTKVSIKVSKKGKSKITFAVESPSKIEWLINKLSDCS